MLLQKYWSPDIPVRKTSQKVKMPRKIAFMVSPDAAYRNVRAPFGMFARVFSQEVLS